MRNMQGLDVKKIAAKIVILRTNGQVRMPKLEPQRQTMTAAVS